MDKLQAEIRIKQIDREIERLNKEKKELQESKDMIHPNKKVNDYLSRYSGKRLLEAHKLDEYGTWEVRGEDPNCDMGGHHHNPHLGFFEGTLEQVLTHATNNLGGFWQWGAGGEIKKVKPNLITKL
jgi:uncharacterized protein (UPF0335 family)